MIIIINDHHIEVNQMLKVLNFILSAASRTGALGRRVSNYDRDSQDSQEIAITFKHFNNVTVLIVWTVELLKYLTVISTFAKSCNSFVFKKHCHRILVFQVLWFGWPPYKSVNLHKK